MIITRSDIIGGASIYVRDLCLGLSRLGHEATVFVGGDGPYVSDLRQHGVAFKRVPGLQRAISPRQDLRAYRTLHRYLRELSPDVIVAHTSKSGALARFVSRSLGIPVIYTPHCWAFEKGVPALRAGAYLVAERLLSRLPGRILNVSRYERNMALSFRIGDSSDHLVIHNGVPDVDPVLRADPRQHPPQLTMIARFEPQKDHWTFLEALKQLTDLDWTVAMVGDGPLEERARDWVRANGLADRIKFLGAQREVASILARSQVFVLTSNWESFPLTILEAMRAGLPVIAADVGGISEAVIGGVTGYLVPRGDEHELRRWLRVVLTSPEQRARLGSNGRARYLTHFTHERMLDEVMSLYATVSNAEPLPTREAV
jgi:glycosyltransferase involved in cell wall biosynthesis